MTAGMQCMSEKQFEAFLVERLQGWLKGRIAPGERFQFRSTDPENTRKLMDALRAVAGETFLDGENPLSFFRVDGIRLIVAAHSDSPELVPGSYTDNYLAHLRDEVVQSGDALLMVHNSSLDTITNSTFDLASSGAVWSASSIRDHLDALIDNRLGNRMVSRCLLNHQFSMIEADRSSVFGFRHLHDAMIDGDLRFDELGLFNDPEVLDLQSEKQAQKRLEENRKLRAEIQFEVDHHPNELEERLTLFGSKFISDNFKDGSDEWRNRSYNEIIAEIEKQKNKSLEFVGVESNSCALQHRTKKESGAGARDIHILLMVPKGAPTYSFELLFAGATLAKEQLELQPKKLKNLSIDLRNGHKSKFTITGTTPVEPLFFGLKLVRELSSEVYKFSCMVIEEGLFELDDIYHQFLVNRSKQALVLQAEQQILTVNSELDNVYVLEDCGLTVDVSRYGRIDFAQMYEESDEVDFVLQSGVTQLQVQVEGESAKESLVLPLLMDANRTNQLYRDEYNATYKTTRGTVVLDNQEIKPVFLRQQLLRAEQVIIDGQLICWDEVSGKGVGISFLNDMGIDELGSCYQAFLGYFNEGSRRTLPSLAGWGPQLLELAKRYTEAYLRFLESREKGKTLDSKAKLVMRLGTATLRDGSEGKSKQYLTPFHPLVVAYYVELIESILADGDDRSFGTLPLVTRKRLTARGLIPHLYDAEHGYSYTQVVEENPFWTEIVPREDSSFEFVIRMVSHKITEFTETFSQLFSQVSDAPLLINSVNNAENKELFEGILDYYQDNLDDALRIHVNLYDDEQAETEFDKFAEMASYDEIKQRYRLEKGPAKRNADTIVDLLRTRLSFSKFLNGQVQEQSYAHLTFFRNNQIVDARDNNIDEHLSGIACDGLLNGESSRSENGSYFTAFGLSNVDCSDKTHLKIARLFGRLWRPAKKQNDTYHDHSAISLAVSDKLRDQLNRSYDSSLWTTIIDPKVTLDFFQEEQGVILIHYSDQYTSSAGYDAITVTKQARLYQNVLGSQGEALIREFNAFNGEWLLRMISERDTEKLAKEGVIGAYKVVASLLAQSDICWVPLSVAEMIRVAGNMGLAMSDSDFSRYNLGIKQGAISDDILFAGFRNGQLYLLPVEVKTGKRPDFTKARKQSKELKTYMETLLGQENLAGRLYRGLFIRQVLLQVEKYQLYKVFPSNHFDGLLGTREQWLKGDYQIAQLNNYPGCMVVALFECLKECYEDSDGILQLEIPLGELKDRLKDGLLYTPLGQLKDDILAGKLLQIPKAYFLIPEPETSVVDVVVAEPQAQPALVSDVSVEDEKLVHPESSAAASLADTRVLIGSDRAGGAPVYWEYGNPQLANRHLIVFGRSGQGKTYCIQGLLMELAKARVKSLIIDYTNGFLPNHLEPEFTNLVHPKSSFLAKEPLGISPFRKQAQDFGGELLEEKDHIIAARIASVFNQVYSTIGEQQLATLTNVIESGVARHGARYSFRVMLDDLNEEGKTGESLANKLSTMVKSNLFDENDNKGWGGIFGDADADADVNIVQLASFSKDIMQIATEFILWDLYAYASASGNKNSPLPIVLDEVQNLDHRLESPLGKMLTEGRKYGLSLILATQTLSMLSKEEQDRIFQASHKLFFAPAETETQTYAKLLEQSIPGTDKKMWLTELSRLQKGECISVGLHLDASGRAVHGAKVVKVSGLEERVSKQVVNS